MTKAIPSMTLSAMRPHGKKAWWSYQNTTVILGMLTGPRLPFNSFLTSGKKRRLRSWGNPTVLPSVQRSSIVQRMWTSLISNCDPTKCKKPLMIVGKDIAPKRPSRTCGATLTGLPLNWTSFQRDIPNCWLLIRFLKQAAFRSPTMKSKRCGNISLILGLILFWSCYIPGGVSLNFWTWNLKI